MVKRSRAESASPTPEADALHTDSAISEPPAPQGHVPHVVKYVHVDSADAADASVSAPAVMICQLPGHRTPLQFATYEEYDVHYSKTHVNRCSKCCKNFPSEVILDLHFAEIHDPINEARKARGEKIYACFAEGGCDKKSSEPRKRRMHMVSKHQFPEDYDFTIIKDGIDGRRSMLRGSRDELYTRSHKKTAAGKARAKAQNAKADKKRTHATPDEHGGTPEDIKPEREQKQGLLNDMDIDKPASGEPSAHSTSQDVEMEFQNNEQPSGLSASKHATDLPCSTAFNETGRNAKEKQAKDKAAHSDIAAGAESVTLGLTKSMSSLKFVPPSIRFGRGGGRGRGRGGFARC